MLSAYSILQIRLFILYNSPAHWWERFDSKTNTWQGTGTMPEFTTANDYWSDDVTCKQKKSYS